MKISARTILVIFPGEYTMKEAYEVVLKWSPDSMKYDTVNGERYILANKSVPMAAFVKKMVARGVVFKAGKDLKDFIIPHLSFNYSFPVDSSSNIPNNIPNNIPDNIPQNPTISPEFKDEVKEMRNEIKELKELIIQLLKRKEPVATVERAGSGIGVDDRDIETSITKEVRSAGQEMTPKDMVDRSVSAARHADMQSIGTYPKSKSPPRVASGRASPKPKRTISTKQRDRPIIDSSEIPALGEVEYYPFRDHPNKYRKIAGINKEKETNFVISMGRDHKEFFRSSVYGDMDKAYAAAKSYLHAKTKDGGFELNVEDGKQWLDRYNRERGIF